MCSDIEALRKQQKELPSLETALDSCRELQAALSQRKRVRKPPFLSFFKSEKALKR